MSRFEKNMELVDEDMNKIFQVLEDRKNDPNVSSCMYFLMLIRSLNGLVNCLTEELIGRIQEAEKEMENNK